MYQHTSYVSTHFICTKTQLADIVTKALGQETIFDAATQVGISYLHLPKLEGSIKEILTIKLYVIVVYNYCTILYAINLIMIKSHN